MRSLVFSILAYFAWKLEIAAIIYFDCFKNSSIQTFIRNEARWKDCLDIQIIKYAYFKDALFLLSKNISSHKHWRSCK